MSILFAAGSPVAELSDEDLGNGLWQALNALGAQRKVAVVPPDITRLHSRAGELTRRAWHYYGDRLTDILPAIGTHNPMTTEEIAAMYGDIPQSLFRVHDWRYGCVTIGEVPAEFVRRQSGGLADSPLPVQLGKLLVEGRFDLILSIGQVVPHEVSGMANYTKNIVIGAGGAETIHGSHFLGAICGVERVMGRINNPVRSVLDYALERFGGGLPILYALTVAGLGADGATVVRGLFIGEDRECFERAAELSLAVNVEVLDRPVRKAVVFLDPREYRSTWLGNKAIYRTRMAMADGGELIILAPGVRQFGEDPEMDALIRKYGYADTGRILAAVDRDPDLASNLAVAAHLIQGSPEGRFTVTYCPGGLSREEIEGAGFRYGDVKEMMARYDPSRLAEGANAVGGEEVFFVSNPALGLWSHRKLWAAASQEARS